MVILFLRGVCMGGLAVTFGDVILWHRSVVKVDPTQTFSLTFTSTPASLSSQTSACLSVHVCLSGSRLFMSLSLSFSDYLPPFFLYRLLSLPPSPRGVIYQFGGGEQSFTHTRPYIGSRR